MSVIFPTKSPVDRLGARLSTPVFRPGRLRSLARRFSSLLDAKKTLDKVYSNGYFENHYPDADRTLKNGLHEQAMQAWAAANEGVTDHSEPDDDEGGLNLNITINVGK